MPPKKDANLWPADKEHELIQLVESRPFLWDCTLEGYRRSDLKIQLWDEISLAMGATVYTVTILKDRWKNMKDTFSSNWNKVSSSNKRCSGNGTDDMYVPRWPLYSKLMFLKKTVVSGSTVSNISSTASSIAASSAAEVASTSSILEGIQVYYDEVLQKFVQVPPDATFELVTEVTSEPQDVSQPQTAQQNQSTPVSASAAASPSTGELFYKRGKRRASQMSEVLSLAKELVKPLPEPTPVVNDSAANLGAYIAGRLRDMSPDRRKACEKDLMSVLINY
ncbi:uncharacterized protein LOC117648275 [Thrips palmi]|uniref:Uncharacterized protein LOC117648275 n=1 Tax=Thrips palmi TaxID=161013 RepID=A0A6P8ZQX2_THRPL|nr:uncharacterized protein LOC117648275 [Thrips palmi]